MRRTLPLFALCATLAACSALNPAGIGGEPRLACMYRDGTAVIDDRVAGSEGMRISFVRRFVDGDRICQEMLPAE